MQSQVCVTLQNATYRPRHCSPYIFYSNSRPLPPDRSTCRGTGEKIPKGELRIGKEVKSPYSDKPGATIHLWYSLDGFVAYLAKGRTGKARPETAPGMDGFKDLKGPDKKKIEGLLEGIAAEEDQFDAVPETRIENTEGGNNKWWSVKVAGNMTLTQWGQIGDDQPPGMSKKEHKDEKAARAFAEKTTATKCKQGYHEVGAGKKRKKADDDEPEAKPKKAKAAAAPKKKKKK